MTIIVGGYIVGYPLGGMTWHHLNYLLGLWDLGHDVYFFEDVTQSPPWHPLENRFCGAEYGVRYLQRTLDHYGMPDRYCVVDRDKHWGMSDGELEELLSSADLMICVSGVTPIRDDLRSRPRRMLVIDTDPVFTQLRMRHDKAFLDYYRQFDNVATFGRLIGTDACPLPTHGIRWIPTRQPVSLRHWPAVPAAAAPFTTLGKWEHTGERHVEFAGQRFLSSKGVEWMKLLDLPRRTSSPLRLAMSSMPPGTRELFEGSGWTFCDPIALSIDCPAFQSFVQESAGELTVVKEIYRAIPSGWFSDRSACYLASGRPVVTQSTGFEQWLPTGEGLFEFHNIDEAAASVNRIDSDWQRHSRAARRIAEEYFDARKVLGELLDTVM